MDVDTFIDRKTSTAFETDLTLNHSSPTINIRDTPKDIVKWNRDIEKVIKDISNKAENYHFIHSQISLSYTCQYTTMMFLLMILSPVSGTLTLLSFIIVEQVLYLTLLSAIFSFISGIVVSIIKFAKYDEISNAHKIASSRYFSLYNNIIRELSLPKPNRAEANSYLRWVMNSFDELYQASPLIPIKMEKESNLKEVKEDINCGEEAKQLHIFSQAQDLNHYSDKFMKYQLDRMGKF